MDYSSLYIRLLEDDDVEVTVAAPCDQHPDVLFHRINDAFVHELAISFNRHELPRLHYLRENSSDLQCKIRVLTIDAFTGGTEGIHDDLFGFLGHHLNPEVYKASLEARPEEFAMLFTHNAMRGIKHLEYKVSLTYFFYRPPCVYFLGSRFWKIIEV